MTTQVSWQPQAGPQAHLVGCPIEEIFYGGARGGGKTDGMIGKNAIKAHAYGKYQKGLFVRKELPQLEDAIERCKEIYLPMQWQWGEQKKTFTAPNGATLKFRPLERLDDAQKQQGKAFTDIYFEELTNYESPDVYNRMRGTNRSAQGIPCQMHGTGNPGGPGHQWVKARYIDPNPAGYETLVEELPNGKQHKRIFIPAKLTDNRKLTENDPNYENNLYMSGSAELVRAWLLGDWNIVEGAFFDCWHPKMVHRPFLVPSGWSKAVSFDWGSAKPFSVGWWAIVTDDYTTSEGVLLPRGYALRYREWYGMRPGHPDVGLKMSAEAVGAGIRARTTEKINDWVADPAIFKQDGGPSQAERMGLNFRGADNTRVARIGHMGGWDQMRSRMVGTRTHDANGVLQDDGVPMIGCFNTCVDSIRTIPALQHDSHKAEDLATQMEDHCFAGETLVDTLEGQVMIKDLPPSGIVNTEQGRMEYRSARMTKRKATVVKVTLSNGKEIICTPEHKFMLSSDEWRYAKDLTGETLKCASMSYQKPFKSLTEPAITNAADTFKERVYGYTAPFGNGSMAQYCPSTTFITKTMIQLTTKSKTLPASRRTSIYQVGMEMHRQRQDELLSRLHKRRHVSGTPQRQAENTTQNIGTKALSQIQLKINQRFVRFAEKITSRLKLILSNLSIATKTVKPLHCVGVEALSHATDVYCITVPSTGTFCIEGGIVVHNCADEWRYFCMSRPIGAVRPVAEVISMDMWGRRRQSHNNWKTA